MTRRVNPYTKPPVRQYATSNPPVGNPWHVTGAQHPDNVFLIDPDGNGFTMTRTETDGGEVFFEARNASDEQCIRGDLEPNSRSGGRLSLWSGVGGNNQERIRLNGSAGTLWMGPDYGTYPSTAGFYIDAPNQVFATADVGLGQQWDWQCEPGIRFLHPTSFAEIAADVDFLNLRVTSPEFVQDSKRVADEFLALMLSAV